MTPRAHINETNDLAAKLAGPMIAVLRTLARWQTARDLKGWIPELDDRVARAIAQRSQGRIVSGNKGYCLLAYASDAEIVACEDRLLAQARQMRRRVMEIRKRRESHARNRRRG
jgi:hypothetical protein